MKLPPFITAEIEPHLDWLALTRALDAGHALPKAETKDLFLYRGEDTQLTRSAWIDGLGALVKTATIHPGNHAQGLPSINGGVSLFDDATGQLSAMVDFHLLTKWKTAGDSLLAAKRLARPGSKKILILGAGTVARSLVAAYRAGFPDAEITLWNRSMARAQALADAMGVRVAQDIKTAVRASDIVTSATMTTDPILRGAWFRPGQHIDLIGAYRPDMREADNDAMRRARIFVDSRETTIGHIGEIEIPLQAGVIRETDICASHYEPADMVRESETDITLFKNGGGAHLDLMTARYVLDAWKTTTG
ncbi:MAG: NAD(P)-binding domain-containing protein [Marinovum sp.]|nr:NAD(P)-binding domain-containing protein [Marinovum sp.]